MKMNKQLTRATETCTKQKIMTTTNLHQNLPKPIILIIQTTKSLFLTNLPETKITTILLTRTITT